MKQNNYRHDVITLGETMLRLAAPSKQRLEQCSSLDMTVGGSELTVAANLAGIGAKTAWISRLPENPMGRFVANKAREQGVDTSRIVWTNDPDARVGLYFVEMGAKPRPSRVYYDRRNSAASRMTFAETNWSALLPEARIVHMSGITPALSESCAGLTFDLLKAAREEQCLVSFDLNYRSKLWSEGDAGECYRRLLPDIDILITNRYDCERFFSLKGDESEMAVELSDKYSIRIIAFTSGEAPAVWSGRWSASLWYDGEFFAAPEAEEIEVVDRFGAGDAFAAGLLKGVLEDDPETALQLGNAMAAISQTTFGDIAWIREHDLTDYFENKNFNIRR
ncbi:sugar kinase [candidate division KSB1 bacterium]|nr:sugar kinase [candidate division KSB1 bacterium]